jgi:hypothetical protein
MTVREHILNFTLAVALCVGISWLTDREPPVRYDYVQALYEDEATGAPKPVPGGSIGVEFDITRLQICRTKAERWFRDYKGWDYDLPNEEFTPEDIGEFKLKKMIALDRRIIPGMGTLKIDVYWYCNPIHYLWPIHTVLKVPVVVERP